MSTPDLPHYCIRHSGKCRRLSIEGTSLEGWELEIYGKNPMMTLVYKKRVPVYEGNENDEV